MSDPPKKFTLDLPLKFLTHMFCVLHRIFSLCLVFIIIIQNTPGAFSAPTANRREVSQWTHFRYYGDMWAVWVLLALMPLTQTRPKGGDQASDGVKHTNLSNIFFRIENVWLKVKLWTYGFMGCPSCRVREKTVRFEGVPEPSKIHTSVSTFKYHLSSTNSGLFNCQVCAQRYVSGGFLNQ